jgi:hypothetical protein
VEVRLANPRKLRPRSAIAFRFTCRYYRGAYYKALFLTPPARAVRGVQRRHREETALFVAENLQRYALYGALFLLVRL